MIEINNFQQANEALSRFVSLHPVTRYSLDRMIELMNYLGNPQNKFKVIHVAGTSGKTSTSYYAASLLKESGFKVGLTVSPHVDGVNERAQIDLAPLPEKEYCQELNLFLNIVQLSGLHASYFEVLMAFAYWLFAKYKVDYAVIEVGLGGLLDGTNVIERSDKVCIITDIGLDHVEILGNTLDKIAFQKAGIITDGNAVFMYRQQKIITDVIINKCHDVNADMHLIESNCQKDDHALNLFQQRNFYLAFQAVVYVLRRDYGYAMSKSVENKASAINIPARMEMTIYRNKQLILDGSHNDQKIGALVDAIRQKFPNNSITILVSFGANKQSSVRASLKLLRTISSKIIITRFDQGQDDARASIEPKELAMYAKEAGFTNIIIEPKPAQALKLLVADKLDIGLVTGSFYLLNHLRPIIIQ